MTDSCLVAWKMLGCVDKSLVLLSVVRAMNGTAV